MEAAAGFAAHGEALVFAIPDFNAGVPGNMTGHVFKRRVRIDLNVRLACKDKYVGPALVIGQCRR